MDLDGSLLVAASAAASRVVQIITIIKNYFAFKQEHFVEH
jgi:hypothetical protein